MTTREEYEALDLETLIEHSSWLYDQYLEGEDYLNDLYLIAEVIKEKQDAGNAELLPTRKPDYPSGV